MKNVYTVRQVNSYIKNMFTQDFMLNRLYVKGEVSNCKYHTSGHLYFSLKDESGTIACVMFAGNRTGLSFRLADGQQVIVLGSVSVYERSGQYQLYAREIIRDGQGALYEKYEALKKELEEMGLFAPELQASDPPVYPDPRGRYRAHRRRGPGHHQYCTEAQSLRPDHPVSCTGTGRRGEGKHCPWDPRDGEAPSGRDHRRAGRREHRRSVGVQ